MKQLKLLSTFLVSFFAGGISTSFAQSSCVKETRTDLGRFNVQASECTADVRGDRCSSTHPYTPEAYFALSYEQKTLVIVEDICAQRILYSNEIVTQESEVKSIKHRYCYAEKYLASEKLPLVMNSCKAERAAYVKP